ncbi:urea ABC transporter permease subunit UrtC [Superficieibacter electus]|uniref:Urea ABC transporter permease subunit UrtC n=1 Tax=Superficieibacter electus TaxID=2022662 RepID=A0A2P5GTT6_9ENTR|nr:urea ABC transporter permease subunit UrtC [Superficieibacter electus]POP47121.1 urea ABC transporter permease subunit UrtC [Superficieibacter electus]POP49967.1 urea ABC transporter permease subunit UrtC [Superficieibacter electus]
MSQPLTLTLAQRAPFTIRIFGGLFIVGLLILPFLALLPASHPLALSTWMLTLTGKILCYAVVAVALDLVWGYAGMLSLGHGIFFALGGYAMGMYLMRQAAGDGLPAFMSFLAWDELPWFWWGTEHFAWAMILVVLVPGLLALVFGYFAFRSKIKGVYFSIMTQALTFAGMLLFFRNETGFGGNNGFTGFTTLLGFSVTATSTRVALFLGTVILLLASLALGYALAKSKFGRVLTAVRDAENRLMFCGYDPRGFKLLVWTLSAVLCGLAGALYVPQVGIINPGEMSPTNSIEAAIWVALGGRGTLIGPVLGAGLVNGAKSFFTVAMPEYWQLFLGLIFILVTLFLPRGVIGLLRKGEK